MCDGGYVRPVCHMNGLLNWQKFQSVKWSCGLKKTVNRDSGVQLDASVTGEWNLAFLDHIHMTAVVARGRRKYSVSFPPEPPEFQAERPPPASFPAASWASHHLCWSLGSTIVSCWPPEGLEGHVQDSEGSEGAPALSAQCWNRWARNIYGWIY